MLQAYLHAHESILLGTRTDPIINFFSLIFYRWTNIRTIVINTIFTINSVMYTTIYSEYRCVES